MHTYAHISLACIFCDNKDGTITTLQPGRKYFRRISLLEKNTHGPEHVTSSAVLNFDK